MEQPFTFLDRVNNWLSRRVPAKPVLTRLPRPVASLTFDDFPRSAWTHGAPIVERFGGRATYFTSGRFCGIREEGIDYYDADDLRAVHAAGHEVGAHTFFHRHVPEVGSRDLVEDTHRNAEFIRGIVGDVEVSSFAFPYGNVSPRTKLLYSRLYPCCRGIRPGINTGLVDLAQLWAVSLEVRMWSAELVERRVQEAIERSGWIVFFTHDVSETPTLYGSTPAILEHALRTVGEAGIEVLPVRDALRVATGS